MRPGNDILKLKQPPLAVHAVPVKDLVERIEERLIVLQRDDALVDLLMKEGSIEEADAEVVESEAGCIEGKDKLRLRRRFEFISFSRVVALHEDATAKLRPVDAQSIQLTVYSMSLLW